MSGYECPMCGEALPADTPCQCSMANDPEELSFAPAWPSSLAQAMLCQSCGAEVDWKASRDRRTGRFICPECGAERPRHNVGPVKRRQAGDRTGWVCHRCGIPIDQSLAWPHPLAPVADHYPITINDGGPPIVANLRIADSLCNGGVPPREQWRERWGKYNLTEAQWKVIEAIREAMPRSTRSWGKHHDQ